VIGLRCRHPRVTAHWHDIGRTTFGRRRNGRQHRLGAASLQRFARCPQCCTCGHDIVDDEHAVTRDAGPCSKQRPCKTIGTTLAGLRHRTPTALEQSAAGQTELAGHRASDQFALVKAALAMAFGTRRRPGDDVEFVVGVDSDEPVDDEPGQMTADGAPVAILHAQHHAPGSARERQRCNDTLVDRPWWLAKERKSTGRANGVSGSVATGASSFEDHGAHLTQGVPQSSKTHVDQASASSAAVITSSASPMTNR
jgi:hypothetical protein